MDLSEGCWGGEGLGFVDLSRRAAAGSLGVTTAGASFIWPLPAALVCRGRPCFVVRPGESEATLLFKRCGESGIKAGAQRSCLLADVCNRSVGLPKPRNGGRFDAIFFHDTRTGPGRG